MESLEEALLQLRELARRHSDDLCGGMKLLGGVRDQCVESMKQEMKD